MDLPVTIISLAGSVALLLWGIRMVQTGIQRAFGAKLRVVLGAALRNRFSGFLAGIGVTAVLQSSTATSLIVTGYVADGLVGLVPALGVMLGANVGTTLIVQVLSFNVAEVAPALVLVGFLLFQRATAAMRDLGRAFIGLGLLLLALHQFIEILTPYENAPNLRLLLDAISTQPLIDVMVAAGLTCAAHSSVAVVLLVISFAAEGKVPPEAAFALVLGANLGTAINPVLEGATGNDPAAKCLSLGNLLNRLVGIVAALAVLPGAAKLMLSIEPNSARAVADFHTAFNMALALLFLPLLGSFAALLRRCLPDRVNAMDPSLPRHLHPAARETGVVAIGGAAREALRMANVIEDMVQKLRDAVQRPNRRHASEGKRLDNILDRLNTAIKAYLVSLDPDVISEADHRRINEILAFVTNLEQAGDIVSRALGLANRMHKRGLRFSTDEQGEIVGSAERLIANARQAAGLFVTEDTRAARLLAAEKQRFRASEVDATAAHFSRLRSGCPDSVETSAFFLDLLREMKAVNSHLVAAAAYPILERTSELLPDRMRLIG